FPCVTPHYVVVPPCAPFAAGLPPIWVAHQSRSTAPGQTDTPAGAPYRHWPHTHTGRTSFSSLSSPIFACSVFTSTAGCAAPLPTPAPKTSAAPPSSGAFHDVI